MNSNKMFNIKIIFKKVFKKFFSWKYGDKVDEKAEDFYQFFQFATVGVLNNIVYYIIYIFLVLLNANYILANVVAFIVSVINSFYWNNKYVFASEDNTMKGLICSFMKTFLCYSLTGIVLSNLLLVFWVEKIHIHKMIAPIINLVITVPLNYLLNKYWAFANQNRKK